MNEAVHVGAVRRFNRFYTRAIGILGDGYPGPGMSLTQGRVLYELAQAGTTTATELRRLLHLDAGYLSRMLKAFEARGLVERTVSTDDRRSSELRLTADGEKAYRALDALSQTYIGKLIEPLEESGRDQLADAMHTIEALLDREAERGSFALRSHRPGDMGWVVERHGAVYHQEHGWDMRFEALVATITAQFIESFDPACEHCWIAELAGRRVGCVFLVRDGDKADGMARLRLLFVDPSARGLGLGRLLVEECIRFARKAGYRGIRLWTQQNLAAARHIYAAAGFRMTHGEPHPNFGHALVSEFWQLDLETASETAD